MSSPKKLASISVALSLSACHPTPHSLHDNLSMKGEFLNAIKGCERNENGLLKVSQISRKRTKITLSKKNNTEECFLVGDFKEKNFPIGEPNLHRATRNGVASCLTNELSTFYCPNLKSILDYHYPEEETESEENLEAILASF